MPRPSWKPSKTPAATEPRNPASVNSSSSTRSDGDVAAIRGMASRCPTRDRDTPIRGTVPSRRPIVLALPGMSLPSADARPTPRCTAITARDSSRQGMVRIAFLPPEQRLARSATPSTLERLTGSSWACTEGSAPARETSTGVTTASAQPGAPACPQRRRPGKMPEEAVFAAPERTVGLCIGISRVQPVPRRYLAPPPRAAIRLRPAPPGRTLPGGAARQGSCRRPC